jgi:glycosyltransferase involved in cell wall biosynthesis
VANSGTKVILLGSLARSLINFRKDLIVELIARGHKVIAVAPDMDADTAARLAELGASAQRVAFSRTGMNPLADALGVFKFWRFLKNAKPDALVAYTVKPVTYGLIAARLAGLKHACGMITGLGFAFTDGGGMRRKIARLAVVPLLKLALPHAHRLVFQNGDDLAVFRKLGLLGSNQVVTIVNGSGVNIQEFEETPLPEAAVFLMVARLLGDKGTREFAAAARLLRVKCPAAKTRLVGWLDSSPDSVRQEELDQWVREGLEFLGKLDDVRPAIAEASVVVLPSYREGTPRSILEGMAMGRAIITTDAPGCRLTVDQGINGLKVPARLVEPLAEAMISLAGDAALRQRMGTASRNRAESLFESRAVAKATADGLDL